MTSPAATVADGAGCAGAQGVPQLGSGVAYVGNRSFTRDLASATPDAACVFGIDLAPGNTVLQGGCTLYLSTIPIAFVAQTNAAGYAQNGFAIPRQAALIGGHLDTQGFCVDPTGPTFDLTSSAGLDLVIGD